MKILPIRRALRVLAGPRRGSSRPVLVETTEGVLLTKLRGAAQGTAPLAAEIIVAELADALGLSVPRRVLVALDEAVPSLDRDGELADLLARSHGQNLGFRFLESGREMRPDEAAGAADELACTVLWLDALVMNVDRTPRNPNILMERGKPWLVDHGAALPFQYDWSAVSEDSARMAGHIVERHLFGSRADRLRDFDEDLAAKVGRDVLEAAVGKVPDSFLLPLLPAGASADKVKRRRQAYVAFLWKRLKAPRPFVDAARAA